MPCSFLADHESNFLLVLSRFSDIVFLSLKWYVFTLTMTFIQYQTLYSRSIATNLCIGVYRWPWGRPIQAPLFLGSVALSIFIQHMKACCMYNCWQYWAQTCKWCIDKPPWTISTPPNLQNKNQCWPKTANLQELNMVYQKLVIYFVCPLSWQLPTFTGNCVTKNSLTNLATNSMKA